MSFFKRLKDGLTRTSSAVSNSFQDFVGLSGGRVDAAVIEGIEEALILADVGVSTSSELAEMLKNQRFEEGSTPEDVKEWLAGKIGEKLGTFGEQKGTKGNKEEQKGTRPFIMLMVGVNGSGKTTTLGKLAAQTKADGQKVLLAAGDTFRAGAVEQLRIWADRADVPIIVPEKEGADPAGLIFKAYEQAKAENADVLMCDTAGRLQNRQDLMDELAKIVRVLKKQDATAPHEVLLVLDATVGQNALSQVEVFKDVAGVTGLVVTKLDSSAKAGVVIALADKFKLPIKYIGVGESLEDLQPFDSDAFARALVGLNTN